MTVMKDEIEALGRLVDVASELEVGLADLARTLDGEAQETARRLTDISDGLADTLTTIYIALAKSESEQSRSAASGATE